MAQGYLSDDELQKLLSSQGQDADLLSDDEILELMKPKSGIMTTGPVRHAMDIYKTAKGTPRKFIERVKNLPRDVVEFGKSFKASELRDPAAAIKAGTPLQPVFDPTDLQREESKRQFLDSLSKGTEVFSTVTGPLSVAAGEAAREAGVEGHVATAIELAAAIPEGFGIAKVVGKTSRAMRAALGAKEVAKEAIPKAAAIVPLEDTIGDLEKVVATEIPTHPGIGMEDIAKGGPKPPKFKRTPLGDLPDPNEDFGAFVAEAERQTAKQDVRDAGLGFLLEEHPEVPGTGSMADLPQGFPGLRPRAERGKPKKLREARWSPLPETGSMANMADLPQDFPGLRPITERKARRSPLKKAQPGVREKKPKPKKGDTVTVYQGRGGSGGVSDERWFTSDAGRAASFAGKGSEDLVEIQIPRDVFKAGQAAAKREGSGTTTDVVLSPDYSKKAVPSKIERPKPVELDDSFDFSESKDAIEAKKSLDERFAEIEKGTKGPVKGFDPERHSLSDLVALEGGLAKNIESTLEAGAYDLTKSRAKVGPGNRQWFRKGGAHPDDMIQKLREQGFIRKDQEVSADDLMRMLDDDIRAKEGAGGSRQWSNLRQGYDISDVGKGKKNIFEDESGHGQILSDFANAVAKAEGHRQIRGAIGSVWRGFARPYTKAISKMGPPGKALARRVEGFRSYYEPRASKAVTRYRYAVRDLSDVEFGSVTGKKKRGGNLVDVLDRGHKPMNAKVAAAAKEIRSLTDDVVRQARTFGWDVGELEDYFPHRLDRSAQVPGELQPVSGNMLLQHKRAKTYNLERHREKELKNFRKDKAVLEEYFLESYKQLGELAYFGARRGPAAEETVDFVKAGLVSAKDAKVMKRFRLLEEQHQEALNLIGKITNPNDRRKAMEGFLRMTGNEFVGGVDAGLAIARNVNAFVSLSTSAIAQGTQVAHIFSEAGGRALFRGMKDVATDWSQAVHRAELSGAVFPNMTKEFQKAAGVGAEKARFMWGLGKIDRAVRVLADSTARQWVKMLKKSAAKGSRSSMESLEALGIRSGRQVTNKDYDRIAKYFSDHTQFRVDVQDLPPGMTGSIGKTVFQFGSFMYAHAKWLMQPALSGPGSRRYLAKMARYVTAATLVGETAQSVRSLLLRYDLIGEDVETIDYNDVKQALSRASGTRRIPPNHPFWRAMQNIAYVGGAGIFQMMYENLMRPGGIETVMGSMVGRAADVKRDLADPILQGRYKEVQYDAVLRRQIPTLLKRQAWDRVFGEPEQKSRRRKSKRDPRRDR
jgi:hypothetical protein